MTRAKAAAAGATVFLVVAVVLALLGVGPSRSTPGTPVAAPAANPTATARDGAVAGATTAGQALTTASAADPQGTVERMTQVATGPLLTELQNERAHYVDQIRQSGTQATGQVLAAAASDVDAKAGKATVLVLVKVTTTKDRQARQQRMILDMSRTPQGWKAAAVSAAPIG